VHQQRWARRAVAGAKMPGCQRVMHEVGSLTDVGKSGVELLKCNCRAGVEGPGNRRDEAACVLPLTNACFVWRRSYCVCQSLSALGLSMEVQRP